MSNNYIPWRNYMTWSKTYHGVITYLGVITYHGVITYRRVFTYHWVITYHGERTYHWVITYHGVRTYQWVITYRGIITYRGVAVHVLPGIFRVFRCYCCQIVSKVIISCWRKDCPRFWNKSRNIFKKIICLTLRYKKVCPISNVIFFKKFLIVLTILLIKHHLPRQMIPDISRYHA